MKGIILIISLVMSPLLWGNDILIKTNLRSYKINVQTIVEHWGMGNSKTDLFLAYLNSNEYQKCDQIITDDRAKIIHLGSAGDSCIYYDLALGRKLELGKKVILENEFILEVADVTTDFEAISTIFPYDQSDPNYENYTGSNYPFINVEQKQLFTVSQSIWQNSTGILDYAEKCYLYVAKSFEYGLPLSGFKSLEFTLENKMGDCGNLSSVFITLLRMQNIPARHIMGFRPDGSLHVWADFYMANYGWIPVDITYKQDDPEGNYFGNIEFEKSGFIVQRGIGHEISALENPMRIPGLQTYTYQVSYTKEQKAKVYIDRKVTCQLQGTDSE
jgi:hypothetical protein